jgi:hypothetical protein
MLKCKGAVLPGFKVATFEELEDNRGRRAVLACIKVELPLLEKQGGQVVPATKNELHRSCGVACWLCRITERLS